MNWAELYRCRSVVFTRQSKQEQFKGRSSHLAETLERVGLSPLIETLQIGDEVELEDRNGALRLQHCGGHIACRVQWRDGFENYTRIEISAPAASEEVEAPIPMQSSDSPDGLMIQPQAVAQLAEEQATQPVEETIHAEREVPAPSSRNRFVVSSASAKEALFCQQFHLKAPYVAGAMAGGIASVELVSAFSKLGLLSFFGAGGLAPEVVELAVTHLKELSGPWGVNLLADPLREEQLVDIFLRHEVPCVSASAFVRLTSGLIRYRFAGAAERGGPRTVFAKCSHPTVAERFCAPASARLLGKLVQSGGISAADAELAARFPVADAITIEGDSGGHTDRRPLAVILPTIAAAVAKTQEQHSYSRPIWIGAAGGLACPLSIRAALALGADYVVLGSVHQALLEAGTSALVKQMLSTASVTDCGFGAAPDMFEQGSQVQVLTQRTLYANRSLKLYRFYRRYDSLESMESADRQQLEKMIFQAPIEAIESETKEFWQSHYPKMWERAETDPKRRLALVLRWYLGQSSRWAREGIAERQRDFQIWCGPAIGRFNQWSANVGLSDPEHRCAESVTQALITSAFEPRSFQ